MFNMNYLGHLLLKVMEYDHTLQEVEEQSIHQMKNAIAGMSLLAIKALI